MRLIKCGVNKHKEKSPGKKERMKIKEACTAKTYIFQKAHKPLSMFD